MKYIILAGGEYPNWEKPRQLLKIGGESIIERTIRMLKWHNIEDINISTNNDYFNDLGVNVIQHENSFVWGKSGYWVDAFPLMDEPVCYLFGDVVYSANAIRQIVKTNVVDIKFFASAPPFTEYYAKEWAEPFAFKVNNYKHFNIAVENTKELQNGGWFRRVPIAWELWQVIRNTQLNVIDYENYITINDYTCDVDNESDLKKILEKMGEYNGKILDSCL